MSVPDRYTSLTIRRQGRRRALVPILLLATAPAHAAFEATIDTPGAAPVAVRVEQHGVDFLIRVHAAEPFDVDHPTGRTGPEWFVIDAPSGQEAVRITLHPKDTTSATKDHFVIDTEALAPGSARSAALRRLADGGRHVAAADRLAEAGRSEDAAAAMARAIVAYGDTRSHKDPNVSSLASYLRAEALFDVARLPEAVDDLDAVDSDECVIDGYCYKPAWLRARIEFEQDQYGTVAKRLAELIDDLPATAGADRAIALDRTEMVIAGAFAEALMGGDLAVARTRLGEARDTAQRFGDRALLGDALNNLGGLDAISRRHGEAEAQLTAAAAALEGTSARRSLAYVLGNLSSLYSLGSDYQSALAAARQAGEVAVGGYDPTAKVAAYQAMRRVYQILGDYDRVEYYARLAIDVDRQSGRQWREYHARSKLGTTLRMKGDARAAIPFHQQAVDYFAGQPGSTELLIEAYRELAEDYLALMAPDDALDAINSALALRGENSGLVYLSGLTSTKARALIELGRYGAAIELLDKARVEYEDKQFVVPEYAEVLHLTMKAQAAQGDTPEAIESGRAAMAAITDVKSQLESQRLGPRWTSRTYGIVLDLVDLLLLADQETDDAGYVDEAFRVLNRGRAFGLAQQRMQSVSDSPKTDSPEVTELRRSLAAAGQRRASSVARGDEAFAAASREYYALMDAYLDATGVAPAGAVREPPSLAEASASLAPDTVLVDYFCVPEGECRAFVVTSEGYEVETIGPVANVAAGAEAARRAMEDVQQFSTLSVEALGEQVLQRVVPVDARHVLAVADYPLNTLPLAVLDIDERAGAYSPMFERQSLTMLPSALALVGDEAEGLSRPAFEHDIVIFADPVFSLSALAQLDAAPDPAGRTLRGDWADGLARLPWSRFEAQSVAERFDEGRVLTFLDRDATKANLLSPAARRARILHVASHAFFDPRAPDLVGLAATPSASGDPASGFVTIQELLAGNFASEMVVISGCETGRGANLRGEGLMSLARGFMARGVDSVLATHWPVADRPSAMFMGAFYEALADGASPPAALQQAQISLRDQFGNVPFFWGAYVLESATVASSAAGGDGTARSGLADDHQGQGSVVD
jgi:tetratricopeptide (TPR) repeat protein